MARVDHGEQVLMEAILSTRLSKGRITMYDLEGKVATWGTP
jgi:hypothetical protein